jgi:hypothetical protein
MLFCRAALLYRAALPLSSRTVAFVSGIIRRHYCEWPWSNAAVNSPSRSRIKNLKARVRGDV